MKRLKFHPSTLILFSALIVAFTFAGRSIPASPGKPGNRITGRPLTHTNNATDRVTEDIEKMERQYKDALIRGDSALFLNCYTPDACILAPNTPQLCGQQGIARFFKGAYYQAGIRDATFTHIGLYGQTQEYVTQQGAFEVFNEAQHSLGKGKVLILWKKTADGWKMFRHSLNFDAPMPAPPASSPN